MDNSYKFTGVVCEIDDLFRISAYFAKREVKLRYTDVDFKNNIVERKAKFVFKGENLQYVEGLRIDDVVEFTFSIEGLDYVKDDKTYNFTSLVVTDVNIMSSPSRDTKADKEAVITSQGRDYEKRAKAASDEELAGAFGNDPLVQYYEDNKKIDLKDVPSDLPF